MANIFPFRGVRYDISKIGDLSKVVTQPYDKIDNERMRGYYQQSPYNFTRIIKAEVKPDEPGSNRYTRANGYIDTWMQEGILKRDKRPSIYVYHQRYKVEDDIRTRKGFVALAQTERFGEGVKAHEKTLEGPKADRLNLMRATFANTGQIFMLYSDPEIIVGQLLDAAIKGREPDAMAVDDYGEEHLLWVVDDENICAKVSDAMTDKALFVADGHHRYETACNFYDEQSTSDIECLGTENIRNVMLTMVNMDEPGLTVLATHRLIFDLADFDPVRFLTEARMYFDITPIRFSDEGGEERAREKLFRMMDEKSDKGTVFGYYAMGFDEFQFMEFNNPALMDEILGDEFSEDYKKLDAAILHATLQKYCGIDDNALKAQTNVHYIRGREEAIARVNESEGLYQCVFLMNPTLIEEVKKIALAGERMPQKSTDFYPKLLSGMVFNKMTCKRG